MKIKREHSTRIFDGFFFFFFRRNGVRPIRLGWDCRLADIHFVLMLAVTLHMDDAIDFDDDKPQ